MLAAGKSAGISSHQSSSDLSSESDNDQNDVQRGTVRGSVTLSSRKGEAFSSLQASPGRNSASQLSTLAVSRRRAAQEGNQRRRDRQDSSDSSSNDSSDSNSSGSDGEKDTYNENHKASPKKKPKSSIQSNTTTKASSKASSGKTSGIKAIEPRASFDDYASILQSQEENNARIRAMDQHLSQSISSQSGSSASEVPRRVKDLKTCPFCFEPMPETTTRSLKAVMQPWLDLYHSKRYIGVTSTVEACQRHRDDSKSIPEGKARGWKYKINENKLKAQIKNEKNAFINIMRKRIIDPTSSEFFNRIVASRRMYGRQADSAIAQMNDVGELEAGYYGEVGKLILLDTLNDTFIDYPDPEYDLKQLSAKSNSPLQHLSPHQFVERVLFPELVLMLIISDQKARMKHITMEEAKAIRDDSIDYGIAMFPSKVLGPTVGGRNAFGDIKKSPPTSGNTSKKSSGSTKSNMHDENIKGEKNLKPSRISSSMESSVKKTIEQKEVKPIITKEKTPVSSPSSQKTNSTRPRPRPIARKMNAETISIISPELPSNEGSNRYSFTPPSIDGKDINNAIIVSPDKKINTEPISIPSSFESTLQASQENSQISRSGNFSKESIHYWRSSGHLPEP